MTTDAGEVIVDEIRRFVRESPGNQLPGAGGPCFDEPLVGFAGAADPLFEEYQRIIGPFHRTPQEAMAEALGAGVSARAVVCWVLPISRAARRSNRRETRRPSREWALTRDLGERFNSALRRHMVALLEAQGHRAVAPLLSPAWKRVSDPRVGLASTWSERHAAYAAGLGTFGLNDSLITARGTAHRLGSVITDRPVAPTPRPYHDHHEYCLHHRGLGCGVCVARCPAQAVSLDGHDKARCQHQVHGPPARELGGALGLAEVGCGLCQTKVPCEERIPPTPKKQRGQGGGAAAPGSFTGDDSA